MLIDARSLRLIRRFRYVENPFPISGIPHGGCWHKECEICYPYYEEN